MATITSTGIKNKEEARNSYFTLQTNPLRKHSSINKPPCACENSFQLANPGKNTTAKHKHTTACCTPEKMRRIKNRIGINKLNSHPEGESYILPLATCRWTLWPGSASTLQLHSSFQMDLLSPTVSSTQIAWFSTQPKSYRAPLLHLWPSELPISPISELKWMSTKQGFTSFKPHVHCFPQLSWASTPRGKASPIPHQFMPLDFLCVSSSQRSKDCCPSSFYFCQDCLPKRMMQLHWKASQTPHVATFSTSQSANVFFLPWCKVVWEAPPPIPTLCSGCHRLLLPILSLQYNPCNFNSWFNLVY